MISVFQGRCHGCTCSTPTDMAAAHLEIIPRIRKTATVLRAIAGARTRGLAKAGDVPTYLDVGARHGLPPRWQMVYQSGLIRPAFVEADQTEAARLSSRYPGALVIPSALGDIDGESAELKVTREPGRSSLLEPDIEMLRPFDAAAWEVVQRLPITLRRLDRVWPADLAPPRFVKIDVQGFELKVLKGLGELLTHVQCIELEVALVRLYRSQPHLIEIVDFLRSNGFGLVRLASMGLYGDREMLEFNGFWVRQEQRYSDLVRLWKGVNGVGDQRRLVVWGG
jgi:FkbM family methyltransferase